MARSRPGPCARCRSASTTASSTGFPPRPSWHDWPSCWSGRTPFSESKLASGKLSPDLLKGLIFGRLGARRPETLVGAALGVDAAALSVDGDAVVLTTDPITTASKGAGRLAVHVVCNDLAVMGAEPVGLLATLLFPAGVSSETIAALAADIDATAKSLNVEVLGGHTEIAPGLPQPLVVMFGVGRAPRSRLITAAGAHPGDALVLTKAAALEGTHILANDFGSRLPASLVQEAQSYAAELSVVPEARIAADHGATAMHDPTEGGIIGAVWELAEASNCGFRVLVESIPIRAATRAICETLAVDPLRLIASGALLIACPDGARMVSLFAEHNIPATVIGELAAGGARELLHPGGLVEPVEQLPRDELYRFLETQQIPGNQATSGEAVHSDTSST